MALTTVQEPSGVEYLPKTRRGIAFPAFDDRFHGDNTFRWTHDGDTVLSAVFHTLSINHTTQKMIVLCHFKRMKAKGITKHSLVTDQVVHQDVFIWNARRGFMGWLWTTAVTSSH